MKEEKPDILEMLIRHELTIKQLYEKFAVMFPIRQEFWKSLAEDEQKHSDWLGGLRSEKAIENMSSYNRLKPQAIKTSIGYVERQIAKAQEGRFSLLEAFSIAKDLESALLENHLSRISNSFPAEIKSVLMELAVETERHRRAVVEALAGEIQ